MRVMLQGGKTRLLTECNDSCVHLAELLNTGMEKK